MTTTIPIPGGEAVLRDANELTERQRRLVRNTTVVASGVLGRVPKELLQAQEDAVKAATDDPDSVSARAAVAAATEAVDRAVIGLNLSMEDAEKISSLQDAAIIALLVSWTLPAPLPTVETVQDLPGALYDALALASRGLSAAVSVDFSPDPDQTSPTGPSSDSDGRLRDEQASPSTPPSPTFGAPTATESYIPA